MAVVSYEQQNVQNVQALLDFMKGHPDKGPFEIGYIQARRMVLLGKGHTQTDVAMVNEAGGGTPPYSGKLELLTIEEKKTFKTEKQLVVYIFPNGTKGAMNELESAIKAAIDGTSVQGWPIKYAWQ